MNGDCTVIRNKKTGKFRHLSVRKDSYCIREEQNGAIVETERVKHDADSLRNVWNENEPINEFYKKIPITENDEGIKFWIDHLKRLNQ
jgi:hypothetical protein